MTIYPLSLQEEIKSYLNKLAHSDPFDEDGPEKPLRPASIRNTQAHLRQYLDALVNAGEDPKSFGSLKDVVTADLIKKAFTQIMDRRGLDDFPPALHNIVCTLTAIGRHHIGLKPKKLKAVLKVKKKVAHNPEGMTAKNAKRLAKFDDWQNVVRLMSLPEDLMDRADANPHSRMSGLLAIRSLLSKIRIVPDGEGLALELVGELAGLLALGQTKTASESVSQGRSVSMVAGVGFEPTTFRL